MPRLLLVHHTPSPAMAAILGAVQEGIAMVEEVEVVLRPALSAGAADVLTADGVLLGTPANIGYMSGALKHFFDTVYYPCLDETRGRPFGYWIHGNSDTSGTERQLLSITTGLAWAKAADPVIATGEPDKKVLEACTELGGTLAATLMS